MKNQTQPQDITRAKAWFDQGEGFMEAFTLVYNEWDIWQRRVKFNYKILLIPQKFLFIHSVECFLKGYLAYYGVSDTEIRKYNHDLKKLREESSKYNKGFFENKDIEYIDYVAGSKKNYADQKYPEGHQGSSFNYLIILKKLSVYMESLILSSDRRDSS